MSDKVVCRCEAPEIGDYDRAEKLSTMVIGHGPDRTPYAYRVLVAYLWPAP